jgi:hypothetical protein
MTEQNLYPYLLISKTTQHLLDERTLFAQDFREMKVWFQQNAPKISVPRITKRGMFN